MYIQTLRSNKHTNHQRYGCQSKLEQNLVIFTFKVIKSFPSKVLHLYATFKNVLDIDRADTKKETERPLILSLAKSASIADLSKD